MKKRVVTAALAILLCVALLGACGSTPLEEAIIGRWQCEDTTQPHFFLCTLVFDANGRFSDADGDPGDFTIDGDTLTLEFDDFFLSIEATAQIRGNRLTISGELLGEEFRVILTRQ